MKTFIAILCLLAAAVQAETVRITVRNLTGTSVKVYNSATNAWFYTFPLGESVGEIPSDEYNVTRFDGDTPVLIDLATGADGYVMQVNVVDATTVGVHFIDGASPLTWAFAGMGLAGTICGLGWTLRNVRKIFKVAIED